MIDIESSRIYCVIMRAGTSKGIFIHEKDLPKDPDARDKILLSIFGSPDPRQINGLGGADVLTSKLAIVGPALHPDADVDYTFGQVAINEPKVHYSGLCGNISSGVAPFAIEEGLVRAVEPVTKVRVYSTNTGQIFTSDVPVYHGKPRVTGDYSIDGVPGTGARINIDMSGTAGSIKGKLLPTGKVKDSLKLKGLGDIDISIVDVVNPCIFVKARDVGLTGDESPSEFNRNSEALDVFEKIRAIGAGLMGINNTKEVMEKDPRPFVSFVSPPKTYKSHLTGKKIPGYSVNLLARAMMLLGTTRVMHQAYPGSITVVTGAAAVIPGTVVNEVAGLKTKHQLIKIGHPAGIIEIEAAVEADKGNKYRLTRATYSRTARRIMDGYVYIPRNA
ncbi:MAG: 3-methylitaconate isomerase [Deltaproteobacteria bacterium]|nr:3-methylitaconate isomerase [Deltaproteobacteria bacterium]